MAEGEKILSLKDIKEYKLLYNKLLKRINFVLSELEGMYGCGQEFAYPVKAFEILTDRDGERIVVLEEVPYDFPLKYLWRKDFCELAKKSLSDKKVEKIKEEENG